MTGVLLLVLALVQQPASSEQTGSLVVRVVEEGTGAPLAGVSVHARMHGEGGRGVTIETDTNGRAVFARLATGQYEVRASSATHLATGSRAVSRRFLLPPPPPPHGTDAVIMHMPGYASVPIAGGAARSITFRLEPGGTVSGVVTASGNAVSGVMVELRSKLERSVAGQPVTSTFRQTRSDPAGAFLMTGIPPGQYLLAAVPIAADAFRRNDIYHPGTINAAEATTLRVEPGSAHSVLFDFERVPTVAVGGRVVDSGTDGRRKVIFRRLDQDTGDAIHNMLAEMAADGGFASPWTKSGVHGIRYTREASDGRVLAAATAIVPVRRKPISDIELLAVSAASMSGRFVFADTGHVSSRQTSLYFQPEGQDAWMRASLATDGVMRDDGSFAAASIFGRNRIQVNPPDGWIVEAILLSDGRNLLKEAFDFEPGRHYADVRVVLSNRSATLRVSLSDALARTPGLAVKVWPEDESLWRDYRELRSARPEPDGSLSVTGLRPGETYFVTACEWPCPATVEELAQLATPVVRVYVDRAAVYTVNLPERR